MLIYLLLLLTIPDVLYISYLYRIADFSAIIRYRVLLAIVGSILIQRYQHSTNRWIMSFGLQLLDFKHRIKVAFAERNFTDINKSIIFTKDTNYSSWSEFFKKDISHTDLTETPFAFLEKASNGKLFLRIINSDEEHRIELFAENQQSQYGDIQIFKLDFPGVWDEIDE